VAPAQAPAPTPVVEEQAVVEQAVVEQPVVVTASAPAGMFSVLCIFIMHPSL